MSKLLCNISRFFFCLSSRRTEPEHHTDSYPGFLFILYPFPRSFSIFFVYFWSQRLRFHRNSYHTSRSCSCITKDDYLISKVKIVFLMYTTNELLHPSAMIFFCHFNVQSLALVRVSCISAPQTFVFTALNNLVPPSQ